MSQKVVHQMHVDSFVNSQMDFQNIRSLLETVANFQQNLYIYIYIHEFVFILGLYIYTVHFGSFWA